MRILQMTNTYTPIVGGVERSIRSFVRELKKQGHEVMIVAPTFEGMPEKEEGVLRLPAIQKFNHTDFSVNLPIPGILEKLMREFKPDVVHSHHPFLVGDMALRLSGQYNIPLVFTYHTMFEEYLHYLPFHNEATKRFIIELSAGYANLADYVIVPSQSIYEVLQKRRVVTSMEVIPTGIEEGRFSKGDGSKIRRWLKIPEEVFVIGHIGRLAKEKNLEFLAESTACFLSKTKSAHVIIGGRGAMEKNMRQIFHNKGVSSRVHFTGVLQGQKLVDAYHAMDIFAFSSVTETQGVVLIEAMSAGIPVVALDAPGARDVIEDEKNGRLIRECCVDKFKEGLLWCANRKFHEFQNMKQACIRCSQLFSSRHCSCRLIEVYKTVQAQKKEFSGEKHTVWLTVLQRIKTEWEMAKNFAEASGVAFHEKETSFHNYSENWFLKLRRWISKKEWALHLLGLSKFKGTQGHAGLILIQIDGFSKKQLKRAMTEGRVPFLKSLWEKEKYHLYPYYSGQPSSTPAVQGELFYGVKQAVPAFAFFNSQKNQVFRMYDGEAALDVQKKLSQKDEGLLKGGSSYSNIYSGGAEDVHFCSVLLGWRQMWENMSFVKVLIFIFIHLFAIVRTSILMVLELALAIADCVSGLVNGYHWRKELKFIITRPIMCVLLRDLIVMGATIDIARGLPIIHVNFLGYDEQAHRRGPSSTFAHQSLRGIDNAAAKIYKHAMRSPRRNYDVWIYSDHGQEDVLSYWKEHGKSVAQAVQDVFGHCHLDMSLQGIEFQRIRYLGGGVLQKLLLGEEKKEKINNKNIVVTAIGPTANIYLSKKLTLKEKNNFAQRLVYEARIPLVLTANGKGKVKAWNEKGVFTLPEDAGIILGKHPYLKEVTEDLIAVCHHREAGAFTLSGWRPDKKPYSFPIENGAHAGPGREETNAFALIPKDILFHLHKRTYLRTMDIRQAALRSLERFHKVTSNKLKIPLQESKKPQQLELYAREQVERKKTIRIMTYNVHSCVGMDGKISAERIARVIARHEPDIVALQELDMTKKRTGNVDQPYIIAKHLEMMYHFHPILEVEEEQYGSAILSRYPMHLVKIGELPGRKEHPSWQPRGALWVSVDINKKTRLQVINTHLGLRLKEQQEQIKFLLNADWLGSSKCNGHTVFLGDFNATPNSKVCQAIKKRSLFDAQEILDGHNPRATWLGHMPLRRIDHIFVGKDVKVRKVEISRTKLNKLASDHLHLLVEIEV